MSAIRALGMSRAMYNYWEQNDEAKLSLFEQSQNEMQLLLPVGLLSEIPFNRQLIPIKSFKINGIPLQVCNQMQRIFVANNP